MTRQKSSGAYMFKAIPLALVSSALISFFLLLNYYDDVLVPVWPDEILFRSGHTGSPQSISLPLPLGEHWQGLISGR